MGRQSICCLRRTGRGPARPRVTPPLDDVFRHESGRCTATLIRVLGDIDLAEDAVAEAFAIAAEKWPRTGIPPNPGGWITTTARNRAIDRTGQAQTPRQPRLLPNTSISGAPRPAPRCLCGDLPHLHRGSHRHLRADAYENRSLHRSHPARADTGRSDT